jgi:hypothetical protein
VEIYSGLAIDEDGECWSGDTGVDETNEVALEAHALESCSNKIPFKPIKGFC